MATTQHSVRLIKTFPYRADPAKEFSNRYYFDGGLPSDWNALFDALVAAEKAIYYSHVHIVAAHGYAPGSEVAIANATYSQAGTMAVSSEVKVPGDCAAVMRMATTKRSTKNHVVYCFSYFHAAMVINPNTANDLLAPQQKASIETYGNSWLNGLVVGGRTYKRTTPDGHATTGRAVDQYIGHRDFPR